MVYLALVKFYTKHVTPFSAQHHTIYVAHLSVCKSFYSIKVKVFVNKASVISV